MDTIGMLMSYRIYPRNVQDFNWRLVLNQRFIRISYFLGI